MGRRQRSGGEKNTAIRSGDIGDGREAETGRETGFDITAGAEGEGGLVRRKQARGSSIRSVEVEAPCLTTIGGGIMIEAVAETMTGRNEGITAGAGVGSDGRKTETAGETGITEQRGRRDEWDAMKPCITVFLNPDLLPPRPPPFFFVLKKQSKDLPAPLRLEPRALVLGVVITVQPLKDY